MRSVPKQARFDFGWWKLAAAASPLALAIVAGCSMFGEHKESVLMPLDLGNTWTYRVSQNRTTVATLTYEVVDHIKNGPTTFAAIRTEEEPLSGGEAIVDTIYAANEIGLTFFSAPFYGSTVIDYFRYPVKRKDVYYSPNGLQMCTSTAEDTQVPAGTFDVIIYGPCENYDRNRTFFVPDTGMTFSGDFSTRAIHLDSFDLM